MRTFFAIYGPNICLAIMVLLVAVPVHAGIFAAGMPLNPAIQKAAQERRRIEACYSINDADQRTYCLARAHQDPGRCYAIKDSMTRSICLAEVRK